MAVHLRYKEEVFSPAIKRIDAARKADAVPEPTDPETIRDGVDKLIQDHEKIGDAIHGIRHLAKDYAIPGDACNTFVVTYRKLKEFEDYLHKHVHRENNSSFQKRQRSFLPTDNSKIVPLSWLKAENLFSGVELCRIYQEYKTSEIRCRKLVIRMRQRSVADKVTIPFQMGQVDRFFLPNLVEDEG